MEESKQAMTPPQATPAGTFSMKIENTTYVVGVHFSQTAKDTLDEIKRYYADDAGEVLSVSADNASGTQVYG